MRSVVGRLQRRQWEAVAVGLLLGCAIGGVYQHMTLLAAAPGLVALDVNAYTAAAERLFTTGSPYAPDLYDGPIEHIPANVGIGYLYPPPLAQLFVAFRALPFSVVALVWCLAQVSVLTGLLVLVFRRCGGAVNAASLVMLTAAIVAFEPFRVAAYIGNVSGWVAALVCLALVGGTGVAPAASALSAAAKVTPGPYLFGAFVDRRTRIQSVIALLIIVGVSVALAPRAWVAFVEVLPSLAQMPVAADATNVSPTNTFASLIGPTANVLRLGLLAVFVVATFYLARARETLGWVAAATGAYLCATATTWDHYLVVLMPLAVAIWPNASRAMRAALIAVWLAFGPLWAITEGAPYSAVATMTWVAAIGWCLHERWPAPQFSNATLARTAG